MNKKRYLFITHDTSIYGASRSLQNLLVGLDIEYDLIIQKKIKSNNNLKKIQSFFGGNAKNIYEFYLPFEECFIGKNMNKIYITKCFDFIKRLLFTINKNKLMNFIKKQNYEAIHLNSIVLFPLIDKKYPIFIHIRELYDNSNDKIFFSFINNSKGVIFIDKEVSKPFHDLKVKSIILNNPFNMSGVTKYISKSKTNVIIFSMIGAISEEKGVDFIIKTFLKTTNKSFRLYIVGAGTKNYVQECKKIAELDERIKFYGEEPEIEKIYAMSDCIIRGEDIPRVGRTIYEGLYSGCKVLVPYSQDMKEIEDYGIFEDKIIFYTARDESSLLEIFNYKDFARNSETFKISNVSEYRNSFFKFLNGIEK